MFARAGIVACTVACVVSALSFAGVARAADGDKVKPRLTQVGQETEFVTPPAPWGVDAEHTNDDMRVYRWEACAEAFAQVVVYAPRQLGEGDGAKQCEAALAALKEKTSAEGDLMGKVVTGNDKGTYRLRYHKHWGPGYSDTTEVFRPLGDQVIRVQVVGYVQDPKGVHAAAVVEAARKLGQDLALSAAPKGKVPADATVAFDWKAVMAKAPGQTGVDVGDVPTIKSVDAVTGKKFSLTDYRGKIVVVDFWATWCGPCMNEADHMVQLNREWAPKGTQFIGISLDNDRNQMLTVVKERGFEWPQVFGGNGWQSPAAQAWGVASIPCTLVINPEGEVIWRGHPQALEGALKTAFENFPPHEVKPGAPDETAKKPAAAVAVKAAEKPVEKPAEKVVAKTAEAPAAAAAPASAADQLAAAKLMKSTQPAEAYAALRTLAKAGAATPEARAAKQEMAEMENDDATAKKVMAGEGRAYSAFSMAQNFAKLGQKEKAEERYQQIVKDFPETMCAVVAKRELAK